MEKIQRISRNVAEVITTDELANLIAGKSRPRAYVGYEPSGEIHLGHMLTVSKLKDLMQEDFEIVVLLADIHAHLNEKGTLEQVRELADKNRKCFEALGLNQAEFRLGSDFELGEDYILNVYKLSRLTTLKRARRSMDEVSRSVEDPKVSQMIYPLMQAIDIAHLEIDVAVGGMDQRKIHMLARENLLKLGFRVPVCIHLPILLGLDGEKMSSSKKNYISVLDEPNVIRKKIKSAYCPQETENNPILQLFKFLLFPEVQRKEKEIEIERPLKYGGSINFRSYEELEQNYREHKLHPVDLKNSASELLIQLTETARKEFQRQG